ncbi:579_t:CDS:2, partial [Funneliformis geosporum]
AENNNADAQCNLAFLYKNGEGVKKNLKEALYWYKKSANYESAFEWYNKSAKQNYSDAQNMIEIGKYSIELYEKLAKQNNNEIQHYLGLFYENGIKIEKDYKKAFYWYQKAAKNGNNFAQYHLGKFYLNGFGVKEDEDKAFVLFEKSAKQDNCDAQSYLGSKSNVWNNANCSSEFISAKATISPSTSAISYIEVEKLEKLLIIRKNDIDCLLESQPIYAIGVDFPKNSTKPCINCWVIKSLDTPVLECLETMFDDQYEVIYQVIPINKSSKDNMDLQISQDFIITTNIWVEITHEKKIGNLKFNIDVNGCGIGNMLSNNCPSLKNQGFGYALHSIKLHVSSIPENTFRIVGESQPIQPNPTFEVSKGVETAFIVAINNLLGSKKKVNTVKSTSRKWNLQKEHNRKGEFWSYQYNDNNPDVNNNYRGAPPPSNHSGHWHMKKQMRGFCINISQDLHFQYKIFRRFRTLPNTKPKLLPCPRMVHNLEISFNDLIDFNEKFANIEDYYYENDEINITVGDNKNKNIIENFQILDGKIERSKLILK